jgi:hypothetical protein
MYEDILPDEENREDAQKSSRPQQLSLFPDWQDDENPQQERERQGEPLDSPDAASPTDRPGRSTGPRTKEGKAKSSMNRLLHGCRSKKAVLPHEDPAEYAATVQHWFDLYNPQEHDEVTLVEETALAHWHFLRASKHLEDIESHLPGNAWNWTDEHQQLFNNFSRYKTTAERSLIRWYKELEAYEGRQLHYEQARENIRAKIASSERDWLKKREKTLPEPFKVTQFVQVENEDQGCTTGYYPSNQKILDDVAARPYKPLLIQRILEFPQGVPPEYSWAYPDHMQRNAACSAVQRFFYDDWLIAIAREKSSGHAGPIGIPHPHSGPQNEP